MKWLFRSLVLILIPAATAIAGQGGLQGLPTADATFPEASLAEIALGRLLFYDPILSGNRDVACATCHNPRFGTSDGLSLGLGDGGIGLGPSRHFDPENMPQRRIARNAPALFNMGAEKNGIREFHSLFDDGRLEADPTRASGIRTPMGAEMETGFGSVLAAQAMFPVLAADEMAGHYSESDVSQAVSQGVMTGPGGAWDIIARRVANLPAYRRRFDQVIGAARPIAFTDIANAIAAFTAYEWRADNSPFDRYLRDGTALPDAAMRGMRLFYGKAGCARCHSGQFQSDQKFHAIAMPQIGPGKAAQFEDHHRDVGRMRVTGQARDAYRFRTPSLRNLAITGPYGHDGAYASLKAVVLHHLNPVASLRSYDPAQAVLPDLPGANDLWVMERPAEVDAIARANELPPTRISPAQVNDLLSFLSQLNDPLARQGRLGVPASVPSGLAVPR